MLDIGFSELLLIAVVALVVIGPKDLPVVIRHVARFLHELRRFYTGVKGQMTQMMDEAGLNDVKHNITTIIDMDGEPQKAYDVRELEGLKVAANGEANSALPKSRSENSSTGRGEVRRGAEFGHGLDTTTPPPQPSPSGGGPLAATPLHPAAPLSPENHD